MTDKEFETESLELQEKINIKKKSFENWKKDWKKHLRYLIAFVIIPYIPGRKGHRFLDIFEDIDYKYLIIFCISALFTIIYYFVSYIYYREMYLNEIAKLETLKGDKRLLDKKTKANNLQN